MEQKTHGFWNWKPQESEFNSLELNRLLKLYESQLLSLDNGDNISYFIGSFNETRNVKSLPQSLV